MTPYISVSTLVGRRRLFRELARARDVRRNARHMLAWVEVRVQDDDDAIGFRLLPNRIGYSSALALPRDQRKQVLEALYRYYLRTPTILDNRWPWS